MSWPKTMPHLTARDFIYEAWAKPADKKAEKFAASSCEFLDELAPKELEDRGCQTRCCLVGHVRHVFGLPADPDFGELPPQGEKFLRQLLKNAGALKAVKDVQSADSWNHTFEHATAKVFDTGIDGRRITEQQAARAWRKTLQDFGYTEDA